MKKSRIISVLFMCFILTATLFSSSIPVFAAGETTRKFTSYDATYMTVYTIYDKQTGSYIVSKSGYDCR